MNNEKIRSLTDYTIEELNTEKSIARITTCAIKNISQYGTRYKLDLYYPGDYKISFDDNASVNTRTGKHNRNAFEFFSQDDFFIILLALKTRQDATQIKVNAYTRLIKGSYLKDGESNTWWKLELFIPLGKSDRVCKSMFISDKKARILQAFIPAYRNYIEFEGKVPEIEIVEPIEE